MTTLFLLAAAPILLALPAPGDAPHDTAEAPERFEYRFRSADELADFDVLAGRWTLSAGALACSSKGSADEVRWRRQPSAEGRLGLQLSGGGICGIRLRSPVQDLEVRCEATEGRLQVTLDGTLQGQRYFEGETRRPLDLEVAWSGANLLVTVGEEDPWKVSLPAAVVGVETRLSLLSRRDQHRILHLWVERRLPADQGDTASEHQRLAREDARRALEGEDWSAALEILAPLAQEDEPGDDVLSMLNRVALEERRTWPSPTLTSLLEESLVETTDGTLRLHRPFRSGWTSSRTQVRRTDSELLEIRCRTPAVEVLVFRYDQRFQYWFGKDPKVQTVGGSSAAALARASFAELLEELGEASPLLEPRDSSHTIGGARPAEYAIRFRTSPQEPWRVRHDRFVAFRGNTHRFRVEGAVADLEACRQELRWILETVEFVKP